MRRFAVILCLCTFIVCGVATWAMAGDADTLASKAIEWAALSVDGKKTTHYRLGTSGANWSTGYDCMSYCGSGSAATCAEVDQLWYNGHKGGHFDCASFVVRVFLDTNLYDSYLGGDLSDSVWHWYDRLTTPANPQAAHWKWVENPHAKQWLSKADAEAYLFSLPEGASIHKGDILIFCPILVNDSNPTQYKIDIGESFHLPYTNPQKYNHMAICVNGSSDPGGLRMANCRVTRQRDVGCCDSQDSGVIDETVDSFLATGKAQFQADGVGYCTFKGSAFLGYFSLEEACKPTVLTTVIPALYCGDTANLCVYLKDESGNPVPGATVRFSIKSSNGVYPASLLDGTTDSTGRACISWTPSHSGDYTIACSFDGDAAGVYCRTEASWPVRVSPDPTVITTQPETTNCSDPFTFSAYLKDDEGNAIPNVELNFLIAGTNYKGTTNTDGYVKLESIYRCLGVAIYPVVITWAGSDCYAPSQAQSSLTVNCDPTSITDNVSLPHTVQYSDILTIGGWLKDDEGLELTGKLLGFDVGRQYAEDYTGTNGATGCLVDNYLTGRDGYASSTIKIDQPATSCTPISSGIRFAGTDCYCATTKPIDVTITCETATLKTDWEELVRCDGTVPSGATITLKANLTEEADGSYGDITKAGQVVFDIIQATENGDKVLPPVSAPIIALPNPVSGGALNIGQAEVTLPMAEGIYWVTANVPNKCYYCAESATDCLVIFCDGFVTGGGWVTQPDGVKKNFGFNLKYKKNSQSVPQGQFQFVDHALGIKLHSTTWDWLVVDEVNHIAWFQGSGTINRAGSFDFLVKVTDKDEPGHPTDSSDTVYDTFSITIKPHGGGNSFPYPCGDPDICPIKDGEYKIVDCPLGGGNIQIHKPHAQ